MKSSSSLLLLVATVALAEPPEAIQRLTLDDRVVVTVPVATNRVTTISFPGPISAIDAAGVSADPGDAAACLARAVPRGAGLDRNTPERAEAMKPRDFINFFKTKSGKLVVFALLFGGGLVLFGVIRDRSCGQDHAELEPPAGADPDGP